MKIPSEARDADNSIPAQLHSLSPAEIRIYSVLEYCNGDFKFITPLIDRIASKSTLYRTVANLTNEGWLSPNTNKMYKTTTSGLAELARLRGEAPEGLGRFFPPLSRVPTPQHRALIELGIAAVISRRYKIRIDRHPTFVLAGKTLQWKTSAGIFLCHMVRIEPGRAVLNLAVESGRSLWLRKSSTGAITYKREILTGPLVVFDEYQAADSQTKRLVGIFIDGRTDVNIENEVLRIESVPIITLNNNEGSTLERRLGLSAAQLRRSIICNLDSVNVPDLALGGEEPLDEAKAAETFDIRPPKAHVTTNEDKEKAYRLMLNCLTEEGRQYVDLDMLLMLSSALTGYYELAESIRLVFYDALLLFETVGWTLPGWMQRLTGKHSSGDGNYAIVSTGVNQDSITITKEIWIKAFQLLDKENNSTRLVTLLGLDVDVAKMITQKYTEIKAIDSKREDDRKVTDKEVALAEGELRIAELKNRRAELSGSNKTQEDPSQAAKNFKFQMEHTWKEKTCVHSVEGYCLAFSWDSEPKELQGEYQFKYIEGVWIIKTSGKVCAPCTVYERRVLRAKIGDLENSTALVRSLSQHTCECGATGLVGIPCSCLQCNKEFVWGVKERKV